MVEPQELPPLNINVMAPVSMQYILQSQCLFSDYLDLDITYPFSSFGQFDCQTPVPRAIEGGGGS